VKLSNERNVGPQLVIMGVLWGHVNTPQPVIDPNIEGDDKTTDNFVWLETMIGGVVPAWEIMGLINSDRAVQQRIEHEDQMREAKKAAAKALPESEAVLDYEEGLESPTADLMGNLLKVPKGEADEVHEGH
jgi:hypothetical protein